MKNISWKEVFYRSRMTVIDFVLLVISLVGGSMLVAGILSSILGVSLNYL